MKILLNIEFISLKNFLKWRLNAFYEIVVRKANYSLVYIEFIYFLVK